MEEKEKIKDRLKKFAEFQNVSIREFERKCELGNSFVNHIGQSLGVDKLEKILRVYPDLNKDWLLYGEGEMMEKSAPSIHPDVVMVPVYNLDARGGFGENDELAPEYVTEHMPFSRSIARDGDVVIPIYSDSMTPKFPSGSFVLIRNIQMWREYIEFGASYVVEFLDGRRVIKNIQRSKEKDHYLLESVNPKYEPTDVPKTMIRRIFQVLMSVKRETL